MCRECIKTIGECAAYMSSNSVLDVEVLCRTCLATACLATACLATAFLVGGLHVQVVCLHKMPLWRV